MRLKMSSAKWRPFCPGGDELITGCISTDPMFYGVAGSCLKTGCVFPDPMRYSLVMSCLNNWLYFYRPHALHSCKGTQCSLEDSQTSACLQEQLQQLRQHNLQLETELGETRRQLTALKQAMEKCKTVGDITDMRSKSFVNIP